MWPKNSGQLKRLNLHRVVICTIASVALQKKFGIMMLEKQLGFGMLESKNVKYFGGAYLKNNNPKVKRPITTKRAMHLVLRSSLATGALSLLKRNDLIREIINTQGKLHGVKVYRQANGGNHLHLVVLPRSREAFRNFIRSISGIIARLVLKAERGSAKNLKFWDQRPFSRIIEWGRDFKRLTNYLLQNTLEALGFIPYQPRKQRLKRNESTA